MTAQSSSMADAVRGKQEASLVERERAAIAELSGLARERAAAEAAAAAAERSGREGAQAAAAAAVAELEAERRDELAAMDGALEKARRELRARFEKEHRTVETTCHAAVERATAEADKAEKDAQRALEETMWLARTALDAMTKRLDAELEEWTKRLTTARQTARSVAAEAVQHVAPYFDAAGEAPPEEPSLDLAGATASERLTQTLTAAQASLARLKGLWLPNFMQGSGGVAIFFAAAAILVPLAGLVTAWRPAPWIGIAATTTIITSVAVYFWLRAIAQRQLREALVPVTQTVRESEAWCDRCAALAAATHSKQKAAAQERRDAEFLRAEKAAAPIVAACRRRREVEIPELTATAGRKLTELQEAYERERRTAIDMHAQRRQATVERYEAAVFDAQKAGREALADVELRHQRARAEARARWEARFAAARGELAAIRAEVAAFCPEWNGATDTSWHPAATAPPALRFGRLQLAGDAAAHLPADEQSLPALVKFPERASLYIRAQGAGRGRAIDLVRVMMLRMLTALPPGKVRFTIVDATGLGQNFAAFMHLADHDEALVGNRIWTEPHQIEQRLADITEHMETVIQKYLREEFGTIDEYNRRAGEIAEPYRVLVVANFPAGFTDSSARRLINIAASGPRCGVHTLVTVDAKLPALPGIDLADLRQHATVFTAQGDELVWHDDDFRELPLALDALPPPETGKKLLHAVGAAALGSKRVEVPFEAIAPPEDRYWTADSRRGIDVPLGRAGATRLAHLRLGHGTSQHVLIAGKTGSGKSTLLHALITNAALRYSPQELELYLIDFKKGVEFKTYVTHALPHARVVAIESEREFGLSVMQRLDAEMQARGELFRQHGVQDIGAYRDAGGSLPRILFIVDEFQEFFVEEDKIAHEASLLLDRLVRQGRAFGIHVHLGSQTLGGAYSLARSTLGQMAVRIALQCSEGDAHLILSEDNTAARLLSRPGEAIYNDANGLVEGNHLFQVVWLPDERREVYLDAVSRLARERMAGMRLAQIVFEGARPADLAASELVGELLAAPPLAPGAALRLALGEPLAIGSSTVATVRRRGGANVLLLGQNDEAVAGMIAAAVVSLAAQLPPQDEGTVAPPITILDGGGEGTYRWLLQQLQNRLPHTVRIADAGQAPAIMGEFSLELARRQAASDPQPARFLLVLDLSRLRALRKQDDEFSFSRKSDEEKPRPDKQFADLLRDGAEVGLHVVAWCDTLTNFNRALGRGGIKDFETRVLLQMSAADSSMLVDSAMASQLGRYRALLHQEDEGRLERFRPFAAPTDEWLATLRTPSPSGRGPG